MTAQAQNAPCPFDRETLRFEGTPVEQARCLLRPNGKGGVLGSPPAKLPAPLESIIGRKFDIRIEKLRKYLAKSSILEETIGGNLTEPLAEAVLPDGSRERALYFVIHDTSSPYLGEKDFPAGFDSDREWRGNRLDVWTNQPVAHVFVNRLGESITTTPFGEPVRKGFGTKFARDFLKAEAKALQIHIELIQPRRRDPSNPNPKNDLIAPEPGFTPAQYRRLALLYMAASARRGSWLVPGYHSAVDAGIRDAHDDPQNFRLDAFARALGQLIKDVK
jgi:hypothetical protein